MTITVAPLTEADLPTFVQIELEAFRSHPRFPMLWPRGYTDDLYAYYLANKRASFDNQACHLFKAVDELTGNIIACSEWTYVLDPVAQARDRIPVDPNGPPPANFPHDGNWAIKRFFDLNLEKWERRYLTGKAHISKQLACYFAGVA